MSEQNPLDNEPVVTVPPAADEIDQQEVQATQTPTSETSPTNSKADAIIARFEGIKEDATNEEIRAAINDVIRQIEDSEARRAHGQPREYDRKDYEKALQYYKETRDEEQFPGMSGYKVSAKDINMAYRKLLNMFREALMKRPDEFQSDEYATGPVKYCQNCQTQQSERNAFCVHCGKRFSDTPLNPAVAALHKQESEELQEDKTSTEEPEKNDGEARLKQLLREAYSPK